MAVYPEEKWPADSTVVALDGTVDVVTGLPYIAKGTGPTSSPSYEVQYNRRQMRQNQILGGWRQGMVVDEGDLKIGVYPILCTIAGQRMSFEGASGITVPDDASRMVYLDASGELQVESAWPADLTSFLPLAAVTALDGSLVIDDRRMGAVFCVPSGRQYINLHLSQVSANQNNIKVFEFDPPVDCVLDEVQVFCTEVSSSASVNVRRAGSMIAGPAAPVAGTLVKVSPFDGRTVSADPLSVHVTTDGTGSMAGLNVVLVLRGL